MCREDALAGSLRPSCRAAGGAQCNLRCRRSVGQGVVALVHVADVTKPSGQAARPSLEKIPTALRPSLHQPAKGSARRLAHKAPRSMLYAPAPLPPGLLAGPRSSLSPLPGRSFASSLLSLPLASTTNVYGVMPDLNEVLAEERWEAAPPQASRLPLIPKVLEQNTTI